MTRSSRREACLTLQAQTRPTPESSPLGCLLNQWATHRCGVAPEKKKKRHPHLLQSSLKGLGTWPNTKLRGSGGEVPGVEPPASRDTRVGKPIARSSLWRWAEVNPGLKRKDPIEGWDVSLMSLHSNAPKSLGIRHSGCISIWCIWCIPEACAQSCCHPGGRQMDSSKNISHEENSDHGPKR